MLVTMQRSSSAGRAVKDVDMIALQIVMNMLWAWMIKNDGLRVSAKVSKH